MKLSQYLFLLILAFASTLLDVSFFSFLEIQDATILSSLALLITLSILDLKKSTVIFASFLTLFFAIFSSLSVWMMIALFFGVPLLIFVANHRFAIDRANFLVIFTFIFFNLIFQLSLALFSLDFSATAFKSIISFMIINSVFGLMIYYLAKKTLNIFAPIIRQ